MIEMFMKNSLERKKVRLSVPIYVIMMMSKHF